MRIEGRDERGEEGALPVRMHEEDLKPIAEADDSHEGHDAALQPLEAREIERKGERLAVEIPTRNEIGLDVVGIDNDMRSYFFGSDGSTAWSLLRLTSELADAYTHFDVDIRDREGLSQVFKKYGSDIAVVVHTAGEYLLADAESLRRGLKNRETFRQYARISNLHRLG